MQCTTHFRQWFDARLLFRRVGNCGSPQVVTEERCRSPLLPLLIVAMALAPDLLGADDHSVVIASNDGWSNVVGDSTATLQFVLTAPHRTVGIARWSYAAKGRTIARGEVAAELDADRPAQIAVPLRFPAVNDGVIFATELTVSVAMRDAEAPLAVFVKPIWIFPENPFFERTRWLNQLGMTLFDPVGDTAEALAGLSIPFRRTRNVATLTEVNDGLLVVGEGVSLAKHRSLADALIAVAARGVPVLCLAPSDGHVPLPSSEDGQPLPRGMVFRQNDHITTLDRRLDTVHWLSANEPVTTRLRPRSVRNQLVLEVSRQGPGWPWWEARYHERGALVVCGFGVIEHWQKGPTPRFLLARLLEYLTEESAVRNHTPYDSSPASKGE